MSADRNWLELQARAAQHDLPLEGAAQAVYAALLGLPDHPHTEQSALDLMEYLDKLGWTVVEKVSRETPQDFTLKDPY